MSDNLHQEYEEIFCEAVNTIVTSTIQQLAFDETVVCTIIRLVDEDKGQYEVTDGSVTFMAYNNTAKTYRENAKVYVTIPKGDYEQEKLIIGSYKQENDAPLSFVSPKEQVLELIHVCTQTPQQGLIANGSEREIEITTINLAGKDESLLAACDTIYISAKFRSFLDSTKQFTGSYGVCAALYENVNDTIPKYLATLDSQRDMFGNPYSYTTSSLQEVACAIPKGDTISIIRILFYQKSDFKEKDTGNRLNASIQNLWLDSVEVGMGINVEGVENQTVKILPVSNLNYTSSNINKQVRLLWLNKDNRNKYLGFTDGKIAENEKEILWAKGQGQEERPDNDSNIYYYIEWVYDVADGARDILTSAQNQTIAEVPVAHSSIKTGVTATVWRNGISQEDSIEFTNIGSSATDPFINMGITLGLKHGDNSSDLCTLYGANNKLLEPFEAYRERVIEWYWNYSGELDSSFWDGAQVKWTLPSRETTMITYNEDYSDYTYIIVPRPEKEEGEEEPQPPAADEENKIKYVFLEDAKQFKYKIKETYSPLNIDNTITCTVTKGEEEVQHSISASLLLLFQPTGTMGTAYTLTVSPKKPEYENGFIASGSGDSLEHYIGILYDADGNEMDTAVTLKYYPTTVDKFKIDQYNVIQAEAVVEFTTLSIFYPVIYSKDGKYNASAPIRIIYDSFGKIQGALSYQLKLYEDNKELTDISWQFGGINALEDYGFEIRNSQIKLPAMYLSNFKNLRYFLQARNAEGAILWSAPLIIEQYVYQSEIFNNWDGSLQIDNEGNKILAAQGIFGAKNIINNTFTGVALGELRDIATGHNENGILGFDEGAQSFGFLNDGSAFIGKSGQGRILFDGTSGVIASGSWQNADGTIKDELEADESGTKIDLTEATFDFTGKDGNYLRLNEKGQLSAKLSELKFTIGDNKDATPETLLEMTGDKITSAVRKSISYYGTSEWVNGIRHLTIEVDKDFFDSLETEEDGYATRLKSLPFQNGTIISIYFTDDRQSKVYNDETQQEEKGPEADAVNFYVEFIYDSNQPPKQYGMPDDTTAGQPIGFLPLKNWEIGDTFNFVYNLSESKLSPTSISSSEITQTAEEIKAEVKSDVEGVQSLITQTATDIRAEVKNDIKGVQSSITQTATDIRAEVSNANTGLATRIDQTEKSIASITQQTISYYGTSWWETDEHKRIVEIDLTKEKFEGLKVKDLGSGDKKVATLSNFETGTAFSIKFQDDRQSKVYNDETQQDEAGPEANDVNFYIIFTSTYTKTGEEEEKKHELNLEQPLILNPANTQWTAGGALGFIYEDSQLILNSIPMSTIQQTAEGIVSTVESQINENISSQVQQLEGKISARVTNADMETHVAQTASAITSTISQIISYEGKSNWHEEQSRRRVTFNIAEKIFEILKDEDEDNYIDNPIRDGAIVSIRFTDERQRTWDEGNKVWEGSEASEVLVELHFTNSGDEKVVDNLFPLGGIDTDVSWEKGETLNFIWDTENQQFVLTSVSTSAFKQTTDSITATVSSIEGNYTELKASIDGISAVVAENVSYRGIIVKDPNREEDDIWDLEIDVSQEKYNSIDVDSFKFSDGTIFLLTFQDKTNDDFHNELFVVFRNNDTGDCKKLSSYIVFSQSDWAENDTISAIYIQAENNLEPFQVPMHDFKVTVDELSSTITSINETITDETTGISAINTQMSNFKNTAEGISSRVGVVEKWTDDNGKIITTLEGNYSTIEQKIDSITSRVVQVINYYGENQLNQGNTAYETIFNVSNDIWTIVDEGTLPFTEGTLVSIFFKNTYDKDITNNNSIICKYGGQTKTFSVTLEIPAGGWLQNETLAFVYRGNKLIPTTVSFSQIEQTVDGISAIVAKNVNYRGECEYTTANANCTLWFIVSSEEYDKIASDFDFADGTILLLTFSYVGQGKDKDIKDFSGNVQIKFIDKDDDTAIKSIGTKQFNNFSSWTHGENITFIYNETNNAIEPFQVPMHDFKVTVNGLFSEVEDAKGKVSKLQNTVDGFESNFKSVVAQEVADQTKTITENIGTIQNNMEGISQNVEQVVTWKNDNNEIIASLPTRLAGIETSINGITATVAEKISYYGTVIAYRLLETKYTTFLQFTVPQSIYDMVSSEGNLPFVDGVICSLYFNVSSGNFSRYKNNYHIEFFNENDSDQSPVVLITDSSKFLINLDSWVIGETLGFIYQKGKLVPTTISKSVVTQTENRITSTITNEITPQISSINQTLDSINSYIGESAQYFGVINWLPDEDNPSTFIMVPKNIYNKVPVNGFFDSEKIFNIKCNVQDSPEIEQGIYDDLESLIYIYYREEYEHIINMEELEKITNPKSGQRFYVVSEEYIYEYGELNGVYQWIQMTHPSGQDYSDSDYKQLSNAVYKNVEWIREDKETSEIIADTITFKNYLRENPDEQSQWWEFEQVELSYSQLKQLEDRFIATVGGEENYFSWSLDNSGFYLSNKKQASDENYIFKCDSNGVDVKGHIEAITGTIGDWTIDGSWVQSADIHSASKHENGIAFGVFHNPTNGISTPLLLARRWYVSKRDDDGNPIEYQYTNTLNIDGRTGDVSIVGTIHATAGEIGGWTIDSNALTKGTLGEEGSIHFYTAFLNSAQTIANHKSSDWRICIGSNFGVDKKGNLYASSFNSRRPATAEEELAGVKGDPGITIESGQMQFYRDTTSIFTISTEHKQEQSSIIFSWGNKTMKFIVNIPKDGSPPTGSFQTNAF